MKLRPYQGRTLDELWAWFAKHEGGNPIVEAAVGAGKSLMIAALAQRADAEFPGTRILDRKSTRLNSRHTDISRMPSSA